ncbi:MAG: MarR family winged helix-turn-helix transcriptional regulator [Actinomycetota bacterium]
MRTATRGDRADDRAAALQSVEGAFAGFMSRSALPRLRQRVTEAVGAGLDFAAFPLLGRIVMWGPIRPSELSDRMGLDLSTVSRRITDLEKEGMVRRTPDPDDRRAHLLEVTRKGERAVERLRQARSSLLEEALEGWSTDEIRALAESLGRFTTALADLA